LPPTNIRPENGDGLFWFQRIINLSLTYLLTNLDSYPLTNSPGTHINSTQLLKTYVT